MNRGIVSMENLLEFKDFSRVTPFFSSRNLRNKRYTNQG